MLYSILSHNRCHYPGNTIRGEKSRGGGRGKGEKKAYREKRRKSEKRDRDRCKTTEYVRGNWNVN